MEKSGQARNEEMKKLLAEILGIKVDSFIIAASSKEGIGSLSFHGHTPTLGVMVTDIMERYEDLAPGLLEKLLVVNLADEVCKGHVH